MHQPNPEFNIADALKGELPAGDSWQLPLDPLLRGAHPAPPLLNTITKAHRIGLVSPEVLTHLIESSRFRDASLGDAMISGLCSASIAHAAALNPVLVTRMLDDPERCEHAFLVAVLSGRLDNAWAIAEAIVMHTRCDAPRALVAVQFLQLLDVIENSGQLPDKATASFAQLRSLVMQGRRFVPQSYEPNSTPSTCSAYAKFLVNLERSFGHRAFMVEQIVTSEVFKAYARTIETLCELYAERTPQLFAALEAARGEEQFDNAVMLYQRWGIEAWGFFRGFRAEAVQCSEQWNSLFKELQDKLRGSGCDDDFGSIVGSINPELLMSYPEHYKTLVQSLSSHHLAAFSGLNPEILQLVRPELLPLIAAASRQSSEESFINLIELADRLKLQPQHTADVAVFNDFLHKIIPYVGKSLPRFLQSIMETASISKLPEIAAIAARWAGAAGYVVEKNGGKQLGEAMLRKISCMYGDLSAPFLSFAPDAALQNPEQALRRWGMGAGFTYRALGTEFERHLTEETIQLINANRDQFGLTGLHRYARLDRRGLDLSILVDNVEGLDPNHRSHLPLALVAFGRSCGNDALGMHAHSLLQLRTAYKLFVVEVASTAELLEYIRRIGLIHRAVNPGHASRKFEFFGAHAHGNPNEMWWDERIDAEGLDRSVQGPLFLCSQAAELRTVREFFDPLGTGIIASCSAASDRTEGRNPIAAFKEMVGDMELQGISRPSPLCRYLFSENRRVIGGQFGCATYKVRWI